MVGTDTLLLPEIVPERLLFPSNVFWRTRTTPRTDPASSCHAASINLSVTSLVLTRDPLRELLHDDANHTSTTTSFSPSDLRQRLPKDNPSYGNDDV